tara:strand:+ start:1480 stop:1953 length:474 start_codon:yes stop_codon:yes gene_type:complete
MTLETFNMVQDTYTPLLSEVLKKVHNAKTKAKKVELLKKYDCDALRVIIKSSFDPNIEWVIPQGEVPFEANDAEEGTEHTVLRREYKKLYRFVKGGDDTLVGFKRENMFIQMLEGLHKSEADLVISAKDKKLHQAFKGLSENVVKEAFQWNDSYNKE